MDLHEDCSREELLRVIRELEVENSSLTSQLETSKGSVISDKISFKNKYATKVLESLPDMLTVISHSGTLVDLLSSPETNHVEVSDGGIIGKNISEILPSEAYVNIKRNLDLVVATNKYSIAHHDLWVEGELHHFENRIFPLDNDYVLCMCRDVTEAINSQTNLEMANHRMKLAENIASLSHWYYYPEIREIEAPGILPLLLGSKDKHVRCSLEAYQSHVHPDDVDKLTEQLFLQLNGKTDYAEHRLLIGGKTRYLHARCIRAYKRNGFKVVEGYVQDMTYVIGKVHELETVKYAVNKAVEDIYACSLDGTLEFGNEKFVTRNRLTRPISSYKIYDLPFIESTLDGWNKTVDKARKHGGFFKYNHECEDEQHQKFIFEVSTYIIKDREKKEIVWNFARDISVRMEQETKIKELNYLMDAILNNIPVYLFVKDPADGFRYLYWNKAFEEHSHIPASKVLGRTDYEVFPLKEDADKFRRDDLYLLNSREKLEYLENYVTATGETRIVTTSKSLVPSAKNTPLVIGVSWDITDIKIAEQELIAARVKAEEADKLKTAFLANMSHEIRTPLNAIVGFSKLIADAADEKEKLQFSEIIDRNSEILLQLINDILDISKIEAGTLEFFNRPINLLELCRSVYEVHKNRLQEGVSLVFDESSPNLLLTGDQNRITQIITNLITNSNKFTTKGEIRYGFKLNGKMVEFYVSDTGTGIPKEKINMVFERFTKLNSFAQGTGLGLAICRMIIEKTGGTICVDSQEGVGSTFRFTLPYLRVEGEGEPVKGEVKEIGLTKMDTCALRTILIAEDVESNYLLLKAILKKRYRLIHAINGIEAVEKYNTEHPDLILMDIKMPELDGLEATKIIREMSQKIPIIALTAYAFENDRQNALNVGCDEFLTKPVSDRVLMATIQKYI